MYSVFLILRFVFICFKSTHSDCYRGLKTSPAVAVQWSRQLLNNCVSCCSAMGGQHQQVKPAGNRLIILIGAGVAGTWPGYGYGPLPLPMLLLAVPALPHLPSMVRKPRDLRSLALPSAPSSKLFVLRSALPSSLFVLPSPLPPCICDEEQRKVSLKWPEKYILQY